MIDENRRALLFSLLDSLDDLKNVMNDLKGVSSAIAKDVKAIESNDESLNDLIECLLIKEE